MTFEELRTAAKKNAEERTKAAGQTPLGTSLRAYETGIDTTKPSYPKTTARRISPVQSEDTSLTALGAPMGPPAPVRTGRADIDFPVFSGGKLVKTPGTETPLNSPSAVQRAGKTLSGAGKTYAGSMAGFGGWAAETLAKLDESVSTQHKRAKQDEKAIQDYQTMLQRGSWNNGVPLTGEDRQKIALYIKNAQNRIRVDREYQDQVHAPLLNASDALYDKGTQIEKAGQADIEQAKTGLGAVGRFAVDAGVAGAQMAADFAPALLTGGGSALVPMFFRSAGGAALTGKESGADFANRTAYALGSGALSVATEQISNVAGPFRKMFGAGVADKIAGRLVERFGEKQAVQIMNRAAQSAAGRVALSAFGEGFEEVAEAFLQAPLQRSTINPDARFDKKEAAYEGLIGAAIGGLGGAGNIAVNSYAQAQIQKQLELMEKTAQEARRKGIVSTTQAGHTDISSTVQAPTMDTVRDSQSLQPVGQETADQRLGRYGAPVPEDVIPGKIRVQDNNALPPVIQELLRRTQDGTTDQMDRGAIQKRMKRLDARIFGPDGVVNRHDYVDPGTISTDITHIAPESVAGAQAIMDAAANGKKPSTPMETRRYTNDLRSRLRHLISRGQGIQPPMADYTVTVDNSLVESIITDPNLSPEKLALLSDLPKIVSRGALTDSTTVDGQRVDSYSAPVQIGNLPYSVLFDVYINPDGTVGRVRNLDIAPVQNPYIRPAPEPQAFLGETDPLWQIIRNIQAEQTGPKTERQTRQEAVRDAVERLVPPGQHMDTSALSQADFDLLADASADGTLGIDAKGKIAGAVEIQAPKSYENGPDGFPVVPEEDELPLSLKIDDGYRVNPTSLAAERGAGTQLPSSESIIADTVPDVKPESQAFVDPDAPADGLGAADAGFTTRQFQGEEKTSRMAREQPYSRRQGEATGMTKEEYSRIFRYQSQTEAKTTALAEELLYFMKDGHPAFLKDVDPVGYQELTDYLREAAAWNAEQMEAGRMILTELYGRSLNMEIEPEEYSEWMEQVRQHETATGQGVQAISKWNRGDNARGQRTADAAIEAIQANPNLDQEQKTQRLKDVIDFTKKINELDETQTLNLRDIILDIAEKRGVLLGLTGVRGQTEGSIRRGRALFGRVLEDIPFQQLKQFAFSSVEALGTDTTPMDPGDAAKTVQVLNMLSSFKTPGRNLTGNTAFYGVDALAMNGAVLLDTALARATGTRSVNRGGSPVDRAMWHNAMQSAKMSVLEAALDVDMGRGETMYGTGGRRTFRSGTNMFGEERGNLGFVGRFLSAMERNQSYLLTVPDEFFKGMARTNQDRLQSLIDQGKIKTENANYAQEQAEQLAKYRTFQDNSAASVISTGIHDLLNLLPGFGDSGKKLGGLTVHSAGLGDLASPFARVAANLATRAVDYNPVAAMRGALEIGHILYDAQHGKQTIDPARQAQAVSRTARGVTGSALIGVFLMGLSAGLIRRADDEGDENIEALNRSEGRTGHQWNLSATGRWMNGDSQKWQNGDKLLDISPLQPFNELLGVAEQIHRDEKKSIPSLLKDDLLGMMYAAAEIPMVQTAGDLAKDLFLYRKDPVESFSQAAASTAVSSLTPNLVNSIAQGLDDRPRTIDRENGLLQLMIDTAKSRTPGLRQTLPGSVDPTGQDKTYTGSRVGHFVNSTLNPLGLNTYDQSEQSQEWQRIREETGRSDFYPTARIPRTLTGTNSETEEAASKEMTYQERQEFQRRRGYWLMPTVTEVMTNRRYQSYDGEHQAYLMSDARKFADDAAKAEAMGSAYVDKWVNKTLEAQKTTGLPPGTVLVYRDMKNRGKGMDNEPVRQAIHADSSLTTAQKNALDDLLLTDGSWKQQEKDVDYASDETFAISQMSDSAQRHWDLVQERTGISLEDYKTAWSICQKSGTKKDPYLKADKINDLMDQLGVSKFEASQIYKACKKTIEDDEDE